MFERLLKLVCGAALVLTLSFGAGASEEPNDFVYQLQRIDLTAIGKTKFDLVIMDYSRDGSDEQRFTADQISALKTSPGGPGVAGTLEPRLAGQLQGPLLGPGLATDSLRLFKQGPRGRLRWGLSGHRGRLPVLGAQGARRLGRRRDG